MKGVKGMKGMKKIFMAVILLAFVDLGFLFAQQDLGPSVESSAKRNPRSFPAVQGATITGQLVDARTFQPLRGAIVTAARVPTGKPDAQPNIGFRTGEDGKFVLRGVAPRIVNFFVSKNGYALGPFSSVRPAADGEQIDNVILTVPPGASVSGRVSDESGHPAAGLQVSLRSTAIPLFVNPPQLIRSGGGTVTTEDGRYRVDGLSAGDYTISVGTFTDKAEISYSGSDIAVTANHPPDRPGTESQVVTLGAGEDRDDVNVMIRFPDRFTGVRPLDYGTATIEGRVVDGNGVAIPHAAVLLRQEDTGGTIVTRSDAAGRWVIQKVPAGTFVISPARFGVNVAAIGDAGAPLPLRIAAGSRTGNVVLTARRGGTVSGTLTDEFGDPAQAVVIVTSPIRPDLSSEFIFVSGLPDGGQVFGRATGVDARGRYRLMGLPPGEYLVSVVAGDPATAKTEVHFIDPAGQDRILTPVSMFYPGVAAASQASKLTISEGGEATGVDMTVRPMVMTQIAVTTTASRPVDEIKLHQIQLNHAQPMLERTIRTKASSITLDAKPGRYRLLASAEVASGTVSVVRLWASAEVDTDPSMPAAVNLHLEPGANISGRVVFEGGDSNRQNVGARLAPMTALPLLPSDPAFAARGNATFEPATGVFSIQGILPGRYVIESGTGRSLWTLKAATIGGRDVLDEPIDLRPGDEIGNVRLTVSDRVIELSGKIVDDATRPTSTGWVLVFSADRKHWWPGSRRIRSVRPDAAGAYTIRGLPAGSYVVTVVPDPAVLMDPVKLAALAATGTRVTLAEGERKVLDLRSPRR